MAIMVSLAGLKGSLRVGDRQQSVASIERPRLRPSAPVKLALASLTLTFFRHAMRCSGRDGATAMPLRGRLPADIPYIEGERGCLPNQDPDSIDWTEAGAHFVGG
jgi:hypothetical protein